MNAGVYFQTVNSSPTGKSAGGGNPQLASGTKYAGESFKKEMDKAFDKKQSVGSMDKDSRVDTSKRDYKAQQKEDPQKPAPEAVKADQENPQETVSQVASVLAAAQVQQVSAPIPEPVLDMSQLIQTAQSTMETKAVATVADSSLTGLADDVLNETAADKGQIKLPFQNSADLVKSAMINSQQGGNQEETIQRFTENGTKGQPVQGQDTHKPQGEPQKAVNVQGTDGADKPHEDAGDPVSENVLLKNSQLDPAKVNIKVAEAPVDTTRADAAQQLADKITYKISQGKQEFDLELNPRSLGKVNIKMVFQNGTAELIMTTSNAKAHQLLASQADALRSILEGTGLDSNIHLKEADSSNGQFDRDNFQQQKENPQQQQQEQQKKPTAELSFADRLRLGLTDDLEAAV